MWCLSWEDSSRLSGRCWEDAEGMLGGCDVDACDVDFGMWSGDIVPEMWSLTCGGFSCGV